MTKVTQVSSAKFSQDPQRYIAEAAAGYVVEITDQQLVLRQVAPDRPITVHVAYDADVRVWYVRDSSLFGLNAEAATLEKLRDKLPAVIDLLGHREHEIRVEVIVPVQVQAEA